MVEDVFKNYEERLQVLKPSIRESALRYAKFFLEVEQCTIEESLERGISRAEMESRNL